LTDFLETQGLRLAGRITGRNRLVWPLGKWSEKIGSGEVAAEAPPGVRVMTRELQPDTVAAAAALPPEAGPFNPRAPIGYVPIAGRIGYAVDPEWIAVDRSWTATPKTYVEFEGRTAYGDRSRMPFHVTSLDWQESDRVLAGIMTAFGASTGAIPIGGHGEFDGVMLEAFSKPRIEGQFSGERMRAWDVDWGRGRAKLVIENSYVDISESSITKDDSEIVADGRYSLGYPRKDNGEEFNARVRVTRRSLADLRHAFDIDDYPVEGALSGNFHVYGRYEGPDGFGQMTIEPGVAYGESFEKATADLRFEGNGVRLNAIDIRKKTGTVTGAAWVAWDGNYSFNADGTKIPVESLALAAFKRAPLSGVVQFKASGTGTFEQPRYDVNVRVDDLFAGDEGIGQLSGQLGLRGDLLTLTFDVASPRLQATGSGRIGLTDQMDADLTLRFRDASLDPYVRFFEPRLSPFTNAVAEGTVRAVGELTDIDHLAVEAHVERLDLKLFDYAVHNDGPIDLSLNQHVVDIGRLRLAGDGTQLEVGGRIGLHDSTIAVQASGDANLGILQGFFRDVRSSGAATLRAQINGPLEKPVFSGSATIANGRFRASTLPSLDAINGNLSFDVTGVRVDEVKARLGSGDVTIGGRIALTGFTVGAINLTARGERMTLRYPEGFRSIVDADLSLRGNLTGLDLTGLVTVHDAAYTRRVEPNPDIFNLSGSDTATTPASGATSTLPLRFNIGVRAQQSLRIDNNLGRIWSSADLTLTGTYERPVLLGRADIDRGDLTLMGNRYSVTRGSIDFVNLAKIEPYFDIEAETRVRIPGQVYRVTIGISGTVSSPSVTLNSDPPLATVDIFSLLLGQTSDPRGLQNAELRTLSGTATARSEEELLKALSIQVLGGKLSGPLARAVEQTLGLSSVQIMPSFGTEGDVLTPSARLVVGKRLSNRAYITIARALGGAAREQIVILEYEQNDRLDWVFTQTRYDTNTFSIEFRVRHVFF
jgi:autotransporter translocation and assembly factor TamB